LEQQTFNKIDLHCHSNYSDGGLTVASLFERATEQGIDLLALTDHDTTAGCESLLALANEQISIVPAVEVSATFSHNNVHIVGLNIDLNHQGLQDLLATNRRLRRERLEKIVEKLKKADLAIPDNFLSDIHADAICRSHIAKALVDLELVSDFQKVFKKYLNRQGRAWVSVAWPEASEVIKQIQLAGGIAVLAHPTKYKITGTRMSNLIKEFAEAGGDALELAYPGLNPSQRAQLIRYCQQHDLAISQGSDFHHPNTRWTELGAFGAARVDLPKVWQKF
jgi:3',5'-nucleoside bisphosphate phosphatase